MRRKLNFTGKLGGWSARHPWRAIAAWLIMVAVAVLAGRAFGTVKLTQADAGNGGSGQAQAAINRAFPQQATEQVLIHSASESAGTQTFRAAVADVITRIEATGEVTNVRSPYSAGDTAQISHDRHSALVQFAVLGDMTTGPKNVAPVLDAVRVAAADRPSFSMSEAGTASFMKAENDTTNKDFGRAEKLSVPITLLVLLFAFGALVAALLPVLLALTAVFGAIGLLAFASHVTPVDQAASSVLLLVGMAVGVDYSLFYVKREREERAKGAGPEAALRAAAVTSGRSVLISGITVLIAMSGLFLIGDDVFSGIGWGAILVVALAIVGSLTVLPAMLSLLGDRIERGRIPMPRRFRRVGRTDGAWGWALDKVLRRPVVAVVLSAGVLLLMASQVLGMHTAAPSVSDLPANLPVVQTYNQIQATFPGGPLPAMVVLQAADVTSPRVQAGVASLEREAVATGQMNEPISTLVSKNHTVEVVSIPLAGDGENAASNNALDTLQQRVIPATIGHVAGVTVDVGGLTAANKDWNDLLHRAIPIVFGFVLLLAFLLLLVSFRSIVIAAKAIVLNLLSIGAAYGVLVWVFQEGHGQGLLHFHSVHAITSWLPIFMFVLLFGLSMDYHVFILSRIREGHMAGWSTERSVSHGIKTTAGTVTAAAVVMVMVFMIFATLSAVSMKEVGVGLATAVLIDATLVRIVLLPASMKLLGEWNWYLPRWLSWLPQVGRDAGVQPEATTGAAQRKAPLSIPVSRDGVPSEAEGETAA
jgi:RND superfamily putative drug exporter